VGSELLTPGRGRGGGGGGAGRPGTRLAEHPGGDRGLAGARAEEREALGLELADVKIAGGHVLGDVQRVHQAGEAFDAADRFGDFTRGAERQDDHVVAAAVAADQHLAAEGAVERGGVFVLDRAGGGEVFAEAERGRLPVLFGERADGVGGDFFGVDAGGRVAAVEDELAALGVGVAVVGAGLDAEEVVVERLADVGQCGNRTAGFAVR